jgi:biopolymer transport protein ExbD
MMKNNSFLKKLKPIAIGSSMADMAMLLLVFFMATTTTEPPKGVEVNLPSGYTKGAEQDSLYLTISKKGNIYLDGKQVSIEQLNDFLSMRQGEKDRTVSITADKDLNYVQVAQVLTVLQNQDFLNVVFMSEPRKGGGV